MISQTLKQQVDQILRGDPKARNSDIELTIGVWRRFYPAYICTTPAETRGEYVLLKSLFELPREDNIKRIRAKFQQEALARIEAGNPETEDWIYFPSDPKVAEQRGILAEQWKKALGYWKFLSTGQTEQLPRPVGNISFSFNGAYYEVIGAGSKKYKVRQVYAHLWECECEAYRFSSKNTCKHIEAIIKHKKLMAEAEAAARQPKIF